MTLSGTGGGALKPSGTSKAVVLSNIEAVSYGMTLGECERPEPPGTDHQSEIGAGQILRFQKKHLCLIAPTFAASAIWKQKGLGDAEPFSRLVLVRFHSIVLAPLTGIERQPRRSFL